ncbi:MAG: cell division protein ZapA [Bacteroidetes bacterium]|nr:cell division protein ZapA [Bacteroidota bacterium]
MADNSIQVKIASRVYPITVARQEEELVITKTVAAIDEMVKTIEQSYSVKDKQDILAMAVFQFASQNIQLQDKIKQEYHDLSVKLEDMESFVSIHLNK